jgi:hypothetical protein
VQDEPLQRLTALGDDEQAARLAPCYEGLLDGTAPSDELLGVRVE